MLVIFVIDANNEPLAGATVVLEVDGQPGATVITRAGQAPFEFEREGRRVRVTASYDGVSESADIEESQTSFEFQLDVVPTPIDPPTDAESPGLPPPTPNPTVPSWFPIAGYCSAVLTILFFMAVVLLGENITVSAYSDFSISAVLALGCAMSFSFLGGDAIAKGNIPFLKNVNHPLEFSVGGGIAVFVIVFALSNWMLSNAGEDGSQITMRSPEFLPTHINRDTKTVSRSDSLTPLNGQSVYALRLTYRQDQDVLRRALALVTVPGVKGGLLNGCAHNERNFEIWCVAPFYPSAPRLKIPLDGVRSATLFGIDKDKVIELAEKCVDEIAQRDEDCSIQNPTA